MESAQEKDQAGRVCIVTGANTGIGRVTAHVLAERGAHVFVACRNPDKARPVVEDIQQKTGGEVEFLPLDLADLSSVRRAAETFLERDLPLHVLVNNAGLGGAKGTTVDGFETTFGVNHLGHFLFTKLLRDKLVASAPARIVNVASKAHYAARTIDFDKLRAPTETYTGMPEYRVSKLANVLFTAELARRLEGTGVTTYAVHPGVVASDIWHRVPWPLRSLVKLFMISVEEGAQTSIYCATSPEVADHSGQYYDSCAPKEPGRAARDQELARELWDRSEAWVEG